MINSSGLLKVMSMSVPKIKAIAPKIPSWRDPLTPSQSLYEFTLAEIPKRRQFDNQYYSTSFQQHTPERLQNVPGYRFKCLWKW